MKHLTRGELEAEVVRLRLALKEHRAERQQPAQCAATAQELKTNPTTLSSEAQQRARFEHLAEAAQAALRESEERFRTILETVEAAFAIVQVKFDANDDPVDYRFLEANPAFEREAGVNLRGKWVWDCPAQ